MPVLQVALLVAIMSRRPMPRLSDDIAAGLRLVLELESDAVGGAVDGSGRQGRVLPLNDLEFHQVEAAGQYLRELLSWWNAYRTDPAMQWRDPKRRRRRRKESEAPK